MVHCPVCGKAMHLVKTHDPLERVYECHNKHPPVRCTVVKIRGIEEWIFTGEFLHGELRLVPPNTTVGW